MFFTKPPLSTSVLPVPADADEVERLEVGESSKVVTFTTELKPDSVLAFYKATLSKDGWVNPLIGEDYPSDIFEWHQGGPDGPTDLAYRLKITTSIGSSGTKVILNLDMFNPIK